MLDIMFPQYKITYDLGIMQIPCRKGVIYMHSDTLFALECKTFTARLLSRESGVRVWQEGDSEWTLHFGLDLFEKIADVVQPRKRRVLSESQKAAAIERLKKYQFQ